MPLSRSLGYGDMSSGNVFVHSSLPHIRLKRIPCHVPISLHAYVCAPMCVHIRVCAHASGGQRLTSGVTPQTLYF